MIDLTQALMAAANVAGPVARGAAVIRESHVEVVALLLAGVVLIQLCYELRRLYVRFSAAASRVDRLGDETESRPASGTWGQ